MLINNEHDVVKKKERDKSLLRPRTKSTTTHDVEKNVLMGYEVPHS